MATRSLNLSSIKEAMDKAGLSQARLADEIGVSRETISQWLKGKKQPRPAKILELSKILDLSFKSILNVENKSIPQIAFRTNRKKKVTDEQCEQAQDMASALRLVFPYLESRNVFESPVLHNPVLSYQYIEQVADEIRTKYKIVEDEVPFDTIFSIYSDFQIVIIPVLWGENGDNGLCVSLPDEQKTFIYTNLEKVITDFKFWLLHEVTHAMTPSLSDDVSEKFADALAGAILVPQQIAERYYQKISKVSNVGTRINLIREAASRLIVSPFTILHQLNRYAEFAGKKTFEINLGPATTEFNKQIKLVSEVIFEENHPEPEKYVSICSKEFETPFFDALARFILDKEKDPGFVQRILNIPIADAKGVFQILASR